MIETWKDINNYEGLYQVSNTGKLRNKNLHVLALDINNKMGYYKVCLCKNAKKKNFYVHRIVAEHFAEKPLRKDFVNHKDHNKLNNNADNLEWLTRLENIRYSSWLNKKMRPYTRSKSGHKYIYDYGTKFLICIRQIEFYKTTRSLEEAVKIKDSVMPLLLEHYESINHSQA